VKAQFKFAKLWNTRGYYHIFCKVAAGLACVVAEVFAEFVFGALFMSVTSHETHEVK
jgi:hypothetical protein